MRKLIFIITVAAVVLSSCVGTKTTKMQQYSHIYEEKPVSILLMPPINRSTEVEAKEIFYSSLIVPLSQKGYYVMPPLLAMEILKEESAYDAEMFINNSMKQVGSLFGVDAVLFTTIHEWSKTTVLSQIRVTVEYTLKSTKTDEILFNRKGNIVYSPNAQTGSALGNLLSNIITTAFTKEIEMGRKCNIFTVGDMPAGKYSPSFNMDGEETAGRAEFSVKLQ
ncbi:MAG: DUF799 domain-containing protein [Cytophagaceae bacterium]|jgi:hypothetical protein|nr:DUF799 domain-containing protein [Cytophagaceae bacterium]